MGAVGTVRIFGFALGDPLRSRALCLQAGCSVLAVAGAAVSVGATVV